MEVVTATNLINIIQPQLIIMLGEQSGLYWKDNVRTNIFKSILQFYKSTCFDFNLRYKTLFNDGNDTLIVEIELDYGSIIFTHLYRNGRMLLNSHSTAYDWVFTLYDTYTIKEIDFLNDEEVRLLQQDNKRLLKENEDLKRKLNLYLNADLRKKLMKYLEELDKIEEGNNE